MSRHRRESVGESMLFAVIKGAVFLFIVLPIFLAWAKSTLDNAVLKPVVHGPAIVNPETTHSE
jgi:hypothetical protein